MNEVLNIEHLAKEFISGKRKVSVLNDINLRIMQGETVSIVGSSGSGKTTLLGLCAGLDLPSSGKISLFGQNLNGLSEDQRAEIRNKNIGFIFQNFQLLPTLTALENVMIPMELKRMKNIEKEAKDLLSRVGLSDRLTHYPNQLSGGEQQRVALARAFSNKPKLLFADEPTGNLDEDTSEKIEELLFQLNEEESTTLVIVTHDLDLSNKTSRVVKLKRGTISSDSAKVLING